MIGAGFPITITNCFGKAGFEAQAREEIYDFDLENDLPLSLTVEVNTVMNPLEIDYTTFNDFVNIRNTFLKTKEFIYFQLVMQKKIMVQRMKKIWLLHAETETVEGYVITTYNDIVSAVRSLKQIFINNNDLQAYEMLSSIEKR